MNCGHEFNLKIKNQNLKINLKFIELNKNIAII